MCKLSSLLYVVTIPLLAQQNISIYSQEKERALGGQCAPEIRKQSEPLADPLVQQYVDHTGRQLLPGLTDRRVNYHFEVISGGDWTEPFALPGGYVFVPARIFLEAQDGDEFAATLAHAIAHAALRHGIRTASRGEITNVTTIPLVFMGAWTGSHADSRNPRLLIPASLLDLQRTYELEADQLGLQLTARAGYNPSALLRFVERTQPADSNSSPLPGRDLRIARIKETLASLSATSERAVPGDFNSVQQRVGAIIENFQQHRPPTLRR